jgi:hypothetical protein
MTTALEQDVSFFKQAASGYPNIWVSRETHVACRAYLVANDFIEPGATADATVYGLAIAAMIANGTLPQRVKTAEELAAEAAAAKLAEDKRNMGVVRYEDKPVRKLTDEVLNAPDRREQHNAAVDRQLNRISPEQDFREALDARMQVGAAIPGLKDEREQVYAANGMINHYRTGLVQQQNREHNTRLREAFARRQAEDAAEANSKRGL